MHIAVLAGSLKGEQSVNLQYVRYIGAQFPQHRFEEFQVSTRLQKMEEDPELFFELIRRVQAADAVLWAFPVHIFMVSYQYKRFVELIFERQAQAAFCGKYTAVLATSGHVGDIFALSYIQSICDDLKMKFVGAHSPDMQDIFDPEQRRQLRLFAEGFLNAVEEKSLTPRFHAPLPASTWRYPFNPPQSSLAGGKQRILILSDEKAKDQNVSSMTQRMAQIFGSSIQILNLHDLDICAPCQACHQCSWDHTCRFSGKDQFAQQVKEKVFSADILVVAGAIHDRFLSSHWKLFLDRLYAFGHVPLFTGKQLGFVISGPWSHLLNLQQMLTTYFKLEGANLVGAVSDESGSSELVDAQLDQLARRLLWSAERKVSGPATFMPSAMKKMFRDEVWGRLRALLWADHRYYLRHGLYDFPQRNWRMRMRNFVVHLLLRIRPFRRNFYHKQITINLTRRFKKYVRPEPPMNP